MKNKIGTDEVLVSLIFVTILIDGTVICLPFFTVIFEVSNNICLTTYVQQDINGTKICNYTSLFTVIYNQLSNISCTTSVQKDIS
jgi:hypothetical protein